MGKSHKKAKSELINSIRKRYDAFLDEEKKRKERNDFILGRLDKMRTCTTIVPLRNGPNIFTSVNENQTKRFEHLLQRPHVNEIALSHEVNCINEALLREISKTFILIPKLKGSNHNDFSVPPQVNDIYNNDWKNKYDILNQLKREELHSDGKQQNEKDILLNPDTDTQLNQIEVNTENFKNATENTTTPENESDYNRRKNDHETNRTNVNLNLRHKDKDINNTEYNKSEWETQNKDLKVNLSFAPVESNKSSFEFNDIVNDYDTHNKSPVEAFNENQVELRSKNKYVYNIPKHASNDVNREFRDAEEKSQIEQSLLKEEHYANVEKEMNHVERYPNEVDLSSSPGVKSEEIVSEIIKNTNSEVLMSNDDTEYANSQEYESNRDANAHDEHILHQENEIQYQESIYPSYQNNDLQSDSGLSRNVPSTYENSEQQLCQSTTDNVHSNYEYQTSGSNPGSSDNMQSNYQHNDPQIDTDESSYQYNTNTNINPESNPHTATNESTYQYNTDTNVVPESNADENVLHTSEIDAFNAEQNEMFYSEQAGIESYQQYQQGGETNVDYNAGIVNYEQNDQYAYYENQPQQNYGEINEHEETSQRYDPNYEQQYSTTYEQGDHHQSYMEATPEVQQQEIEQYEQVQPEYEPVHFEQENRDDQYIEQQLDNEEGYIVTEASPVAATESTTTKLDSENIAAPEINNTDH